MVHLLIVAGRRECIPLYLACGKPSFNDITSFILEKLRKVLNVLKIGRYNY